jgi:hypothetical protein
MAYESRLELATRAEMMAKLEAHWSAWAYVLETLAGSYADKGDSNRPTHERTGRIFVMCCHWLLKRCARVRGGVHLLLRSSAS